MSFYSILILSS